MSPFLQKEDEYVLELTPKEPHAGFIEVGLTVDKKTYFVLQADVIDGLGNVTRTRFIDIKTNRISPDSFFQFTIPPGAEVLKMQEPAAPPSEKKGTPQNRWIGQCAMPELLRGDEPTVNKVQMKPNSRMTNHFGFPSCEWHSELGSESQNGRP